MFLQPAQWEIKYGQCFILEADEALHASDANDVCAVYRSDISFTERTLHQKRAFQNKMNPVIYEHIIKNKGIISMSEIKLFYGYYEQIGQHLSLAVYFIQNLKFENDNQKYL